jgi:hypothetical protein
MAKVVKNARLKMQMGGMMSMLGGAKPAAPAPMAAKPTMKKGGKVKAKTTMKKGGKVKSKAKC